MDKRTKAYKQALARQRNRAPHLIEGERKPRDNANRVHFKVVEDTLQVAPQGELVPDEVQYLREEVVEREKTIDALQSALRGVEAERDALRHTLSIIRTVVS